MRCKFYRITILAVVTCVNVVTFARSGLLASEDSNLVPESGFVSPSKYTNAFFGFSLPLLKDSPLGSFTPSFKESSSGRTLFGLQWMSSGSFSLRPRLTVFFIGARPASSSSDDEVKKAAAGAAGREVTQVDIGGRKFWKRETQQKVPEGKMQSATFATAMNGYILLFDIESFDGGLTKHLEHCVESITFFEPGRAEEIAGPGSRPYKPPFSATAGAGSDVASSQVSQLDAGEVLGNTYNNNTLGFAYQFPADWVVNDKATQDRTMEAGHQFAWGDSPAAAREHEELKRCARVLLFVTKYLAGTKTEEVNPLIVVMAADSTCLGSARFPASIDDHDAIRQVGQQFVRSMAGTPFVAKGKNSVNAFTFQGHLMIELSTSFSVNSPGHGAPLDIFTSMELTQAKDYWVMWGFMSGSKDGLQELQNTQIAFRSPSPTVPGTR